MQPLNISGITEARVIKFCAVVGHIKFGQLTVPEKSVVRVT